MTGPWIAAFLALSAVVLVLAVAVVALMRQIGVLHARIAPMGTHFAGEGPEPGSLAPEIGISYTRNPVTLVVFTSATCSVCATLKPSIEALRRQEVGLGVHMVSLEVDRPTFEAFGVRSTPYCVTIGADAKVLGRGVANSLEQIEELVREARLDVGALA